MNKIDKVTIMSDTFENEESGETVQGITIIIDGKLKQVMDVLSHDHHFKWWFEFDPIRVPACAPKRRASQALLPSSL